MELNEKTLSSQLVYDGQLLKVYYDTVELVDGNTSWREVIRHPGAVVVVPIDSQGNVHMVRQFRYPYGRHLFYFARTSPRKYPKQGIDRRVAAGKFYGPPESGDRFGRRDWRNGLHPAVHEGL